MTDKKREIAVGLDLGNWGAKIKLLGKQSKIPAGYLRQKPEKISPKTNMLIEPEAFRLSFGEQDFWFGDDTLSSERYVSKIDASKYEDKYIAMLFLASLYKWAKQHGEPLDFGAKLNVVTSMPPKFYQSPADKNLALSAYRKAFNRGKSHLQLRGEGMKRGEKDIHAQIITKFAGLTAEGSQGKEGYSLVVDLGYGTDDYVFSHNGVIKKAISNKNGLLSAYTDDNPLYPHQTSLDLLRDKKALPPSVEDYFSAIQQRILSYTRGANVPLDKLIIIGGGAQFIKANPEIKNLFMRHLPKGWDIVIRDEFSNVHHNWLLAGGEQAK